MDIHTHSVERLEIVETGRRRRWSEDEKRRIVAESLKGPRLASATTRRHGISPSLLFSWRRAFVVCLTQDDACEANSLLFAWFRIPARPAPGAAWRSHWRGEVGSSPARMSIRLPSRVFSMYWSADDRGSERRSGVAGDRPHGYETGLQNLALLVQKTLKRDPYDGNLFVFRGRRGDLLKVIWHDGQGTYLFMKRLERGADARRTDRVHQDHGSEGCPGTVRNPRRRLTHCSHHGMNYRHPVSVVGEAARRAAATAMACSPALRISSILRISNPS
ncbi:MAG: IS66 family insertion sequence element accessory protein TnpB, partial [Xanthobacteraceae bacterium]